jgi:glycosyltransferase involved in cell wall biosynthesis
VVPTTVEAVRCRTEDERPERDLADVAVIIFTLNEEANLAAALESVCGWAREVFVVDSFSTDGTVEVAARYRCRFCQRSDDPAEKFVEHVVRNRAMSLPVESEWIFFLDADEWMPAELKDEIARVIAARPRENGFYLRWRLIWMGKWIRRGYYPKWLLRLVRKGTAHWEPREINPHLQVEGATGRLQHDFIHENRKGIGDWTQKHIGYARQEAEQMLRQGSEDRYLAAKFRGSQSQRVRWLRLRIYNRLPPLVRPVLYFFYRTILRGGILDGWRAMVYHFLHALWCHLLIDLFYLEMRAKKRLHDTGDRHA